MPDDRRDPMWTWVDAWMLAAVSDSSAGCSLSALLAARLIEQTPNGFRTTAGGRAVKAHWRGGFCTGNFAITRAEVRAAYLEYTQRSGVGN